MMEKAFRAGLELGADPSFSPTQRDQHRPMTDLDVPPLPRRQMQYIRWAMGDSYDETPIVTGDPKPETLVLIMRPGNSYVRDEWLCVDCYAPNGLSNKVVNPLIKLGLYAKALDIGNGWKVTFLTEWGFELLVTGKTKGLDGRIDGSSSTFERYAKLLGNDLNALFRRAGRNLNIFSKPENTDQS
ncbi:hypothetical protein [Rhizobium sp. BK176]|uniref:hypothetical protein n=1 Tax=Rhizobium sp. BK176 TaxID=2587071 RepID=UPI002166CE82|nr:hypothetical protein [Rhizobium sp. BK176]MCS4089310.1 hypothetical protein [Rhizobium sp. BK176]